MLQIDDYARLSETHPAVPETLRGHYVRVKEFIELADGARGYKVGAQIAIYEIIARVPPEALSPLSPDAQARLYHFWQIWSDEEASDAEQFAPYREAFKKLKRIALAQNVPDPLRLDIRIISYRDVDAVCARWPKVPRAKIEKAWHAVAEGSQVIAQMVHDHVGL